MFSYDANKSIIEVYDTGRKLTPESFRIRSDNILKASALLNKPVKTIIDVGCGTGRFTSLLCDQFPNSQITGIDPSTSMLNKAKSQKYPIQVSFLKGQAESIPLKKASVDMIFMSMVYHHIMNKVKAINEIYRVLKAGGIALIRNSTKESLEKEPRTQFFPKALSIELSRSSSKCDLINDFTTSLKFTLVFHDNIRQLSAKSGLEYYEKISSRSLSSLSSISNEEFDAGLEKMLVYKTRTDSVYEPIDFFVFMK